MRISNKDHEQILEKLRSRFYYSEAIKISNMINRISDEKLNEDIEMWGLRCQKARKSRGFSLEDVSKIIGFSTEIISKQESFNDKRTVELFYLESFSLIYRISPYDLLGTKFQVLRRIPLPENQKLPEESMKEFVARLETVVVEEGLVRRDEDCLSPMTSADTIFSHYCRIIMEELFVEGDEEKLEYLRLLITIARLRDYQPLIDAFEVLPIYQTAMALDLSNHWERGSLKWRFLYINEKMTSDQKKTPRYQLLYTYHEARMVLEDLEQRASPLLEKLAKLALSKNTCHTLIKVMMKEGGYPSSQKSLVKYKVETAFVIDVDPEKYRKKLGKKARGEAWCYQAEMESSSEKLK